MSERRIASLAVVAAAALGAGMLGPFMEMRPIREVAPEPKAPRQVLTTSTPGIKPKTNGKRETERRLRQMQKRGLTPKP